MSVTGAHSRPHCVPGHIAPTAPMIGMVQKHRNYKNNVVKKKMEDERFSAKTFIRESRNPFAEILGFPRMDFREWISVCYRSTTDSCTFWHLRESVYSVIACWPNGIERKPFQALLSKNVWLRVTMTANRADPKIYWMNIFFNYRSHIGSRFRTYFRWPWSRIWNL